MIHIHQRNLRTRRKCNVLIPVVHGCDKLTFVTEEQMAEEYSGGWQGAPDERRTDAIFA